jgi:hypothetical protein
LLKLKIKVFAIISGKRLAMKHLQQTRIKKARAGVLILFLGIFSCGIFYSAVTTETFVASAQKKKATRTKPRRTSTRTQPARYSEFPHSKHRMRCDSCHKFPSPNWKTVRSENAFPDITDYPRHESCLNCHRQQFFKGAKPAICTVCHVTGTPQGAPRHPFPNPREIFDQSPKGKSATSDFQIFFPHDKHIDIVSRNEGSVNGTMFVNARLKLPQEGSSCAVCHQTYKPQGDSEEEYFTKPPAKLGDAFWLKKGTFKTAPIGHTTCFTCHSADTGITPAPTDCATCHKLAAPAGKTDFDAKIAAPMKVDDKIILLAWRRRDSSATFRHEFASHADQDCTACHNVTAMNTTDPATKKVPVTSCNMCHITATTDDGGALNYEVDERKKDPKFQCVKCHIAYGKSAIPESHLRAIVAAGQ